MNVQEDFQYCVMQDSASNKSDASYLFGLFFLTEDIGNNVGLCWVCRISDRLIIIWFVLWRVQSLFHSEFFRECEQLPVSSFFLMVIQQLLTSSSSSSSPFYLSFNNFNYYCTLFCVLSNNVFMFLKLYTSHNLAWECLIMCCVPYSVIITVFIEILFRYVTGYRFFFQSIESGVQWPMCICFS